jgi:homoserine dehydrogenase
MAHPDALQASCCAGLPIMSTLKGLVESGDEVIAVEGILSGTLSYIFNTWKAGEPFSRVVLKAKELGCTEPDPREDLSGMDVARKVVILGRECGSSPVLEDLRVESLVPDTLKDVSVEAYLQKLPEYDSDMAAQLEEAQAAGNVLRYVGRYDAQVDKCSITLDKFPADHPFAALSGTDNIVQIQTARYNELPLIIRGPGAGPEVTAAGCFADMLQLVRYLGARS